MHKPWIKAPALGIAAVMLPALSAGAVVLHPFNPPGAQPSDAVLARWGASASGVVISDRHILTTRHQLGGVGATVNIDGTNYNVAEVIVIEDPDTPSNELDLRVARLETLGGQAPNLAEFVSIYENTDEVGQILVIGGYGEGRGASLGVNTGWLWDGIDGTLRWGANEIESTTADATFDANITYTNDILVATFESPNGVEKVDGEATLAQDDSGGGWFINDGGQWKVAAISQGVENPGQALFGEALSGVRLSSYATQINNAIPEPGSAALLLAAIAGCMIRRRRG